jgi:hypothetical protein
VTILSIKITNQCQERENAVLKLCRVVQFKTRIPFKFYILAFCLGIMSLDPFIFTVTELLLPLIKIFLGSVARGRRVK